jgi:hypothetical protein
LRRNNAIRSAARLGWLLVGLGLLAAATVSVGALVTVPSGFQPITSREQLLAAFDLNRPELSAVAQLVRANRTAEALKALLAYYDNRPQPLPMPVELGDNRTRAEDIAAGRIPHLSGFPPFVVNTPYDWDADPFGDYETTINLARQGWVSELVSAHQRSGDRKYVDACVRLLRDWIEHSTESKYLEGRAFFRSGRQHLWMPRSFNLNSAERLNVPWPYAFFALRKNPAWPDDLGIAMLRQIHNQAEYVLATLEAGDDRFVIGNRALVTTGTLFPEFARSARWRDIAWRNLAESAREQFAPDGAHVHLSPHYQWVTLRSLLWPLMLQRRNGVSTEKSYLPELERGLNYLLNTSNPQRGVPVLKWSSRTDLRPLFAMAQELFPQRADFTFLATDGSAGAPPRYRSSEHRYAGHVAFRSGWDASAIYLLFDVGPMGRLAHEDKLSYQLNAFGAYLAVDPGRHSYVMRPIDVYTASSEGHSTVLVDGKGQDRESLGPATWRPQEDLGPLLNASDGVEYASGRFHGPWKGGASRPLVSQYRDVLFVDRTFFLVVDRLFPRDSRPHAYDNLVQLGQGDASVVADRIVFRSAEARAGLVLSHAIAGAVDEKPRILKGSMDPISGWTSPQYGDLIPTPTVWYRTQPTPAPVTFVTLLYPFRDQPVDVSLRVRVGPQPGAAEIAVDANGRSRVLALDFAEGTKVRSVK